jgi:hypothetical protein
MLSGAAQLAPCGGLRHARRPAKKMPEILEECFARAKSGLMLAPANAQALDASFPQIITDLDMLPGRH